MATWEFVLVYGTLRNIPSCRVLMQMTRSLSVGLLNGGFGGLLWVWVGTVVCYSSVVASLAEMESM